jgi:hypothetical protein
MTCPYSPECVEVDFLRSPFAASWIKPRNNPALWPWIGAIRARGSRDYLRLDAYASIWMLPVRPLLVQPHLAPSLNERGLYRRVGVLKSQM